ncbi:hypothetical protein GGS20DRAFT_588798 [Poronia punctata]|nr:hypothetical protein GGS20DRAFT_588798 [Poronia punctata]
MDSGSEDCRRCRRRMGCEAAKVAMLDQHPALACSPSDHFGAEVTLAFQNGLSLGDDEYQGSKRTLGEFTPWTKVRLGFAGIVLVEFESLTGVWDVDDDGFRWARFLLGITGALASNFCLCRWLWWVSRQPWRDGCIE